MQKYFFVFDISRLIGSAANYAGDGPTKRYGIIKVSSRYYVDEIYDNIFRNRFPLSAIKVGDEVIKINQFYCEHLGHLSKYIEKTPITHIIQMISKVTGECFVEESSTENSSGHIYENHRQMINDLPRLYPDAMDEKGNAIYVVHYVVRRIVGFNTDDELYQFSAAMAFAKVETTMLSPTRTPPARRFRA